MGVTVCPLYCRSSGQGRAPEINVQKPARFGELHGVNVSCWLLRTTTRPLSRPTTCVLVGTRSTYKYISNRGGGRA